MSEKTHSRFPLLIAGGLAGLEALALGGLGVADLLDLQEGRIGVGIGIGVLLISLGVGLGLAAIAVAKGQFIGRGPVVVAQLIALGLSWNLLRPDPNIPGTRPVGVVLVIVAAGVLLSLLTPAARAALADRPADIDI